MATDEQRATRSKHLSFKKGDTVNLQLMSATVDEVSTDGRPLSVLFNFKNDIADYTWLKWEKGKPQRCTLPAVGGELKLYAALF